MARYFRTKRPVFLRQAGLTAVPDWLVRIQLARHLGVAPDWFDDKPLIWQDWALVALEIHNDLQTPTEKG